MKKTVTKKMTKPELRVAVAKDVIASLRRGGVRATPGELFRTKIKGDYKDIEDTDSRETASLCQKDCKVCGIGSAFLSLVKLDNKFDQFTTTRYDNTITADADAIEVRLEKAFSPNQIALIEAAFEGPDGGRAYGDGGDLSDKEAEAAAVFYDVYRNDPTKRLNAIWRNVIKNEGLFKP